MTGTATGTVRDGPAYSVAPSRSARTADRRAFYLSPQEVHPIDCHGRRLGLAQAEGGTE